MTHKQTMLSGHLDRLQGDVELCEKEEAAGRTPDYNLLGTLRVNLEVSSKNLNVATNAQMALFYGLQKRALRFLRRDHGKSVD